MESSIKEGLNFNNTLKIFFRADDIGVPSKNFSRMMELFLKYGIPLSLAVVPAWLTRKRWEAINALAGKDQDHFCWHMHGYRHINYETRGKKQEFGPGRTLEQVQNDILNGKRRLQSILKEKFTQVFTPPWNRCSIETMQVLKKMKFKGISRSYDSLPVPPAGLEDFMVHVDLHTRKEKDAEQGWEGLLKEITKGMQSRTCGIMIHHMRMNHNAFIFLEFLFEKLLAYRQIQLVNFNDLI
ncbi:MAG: DUF2334 domain-containing protein [Deltaproteobacteria bacterium]|nr:DUF2334 domain-containing protein [Deltaproteobacteria bacterium]